MIPYIRPKAAGTALLLMFMLFYTACRKPETPIKGQAEKHMSMNAATTGNISLWDVYRKLPQTIAYNLAGSIRLDTARAEWIYRSKGLLTRIPTGSGRNNWLYIFQPYTDPAGIKVYAVRFYGEKNDATGFTGKQIWVDMQEWHLYGVGYTNNKPTAFLEPQPLATPGWEACMMDHGDFTWMRWAKSISGRKNGRPEPGCGLQADLMAVVV